MSMRKTQGLALLIHDAGRLLKSEFERHARDRKLTLIQWRALTALDREGDGITQRELGERVEASPMTVSDMLERLEGMEFVRREADPADSRAKLVWLTDAGRAEIAAMRVVAEEVYGRALRGVGTRDREVLIRALTLIRENLSSSNREQATRA